MHNYVLDWADLAFASKAPLRDLTAVYIPTPREISADRLKQLIKEYLPKHHIVIGVARELYIEGFDGRPQCRTLRIDPKLQTLIDKVNTASPNHKIYVMRQFQRETPDILLKGHFVKALFVNGSWHRAFHHTSTYYTLINQRIPYELVAAFVDETEARGYAEKYRASYVIKAASSDALSEQDMMRAADDASRSSFEYTFQTGMALGILQTSGSYKLLATAHNAVVPYETYALLHGSIREQNFALVNDQNHYDAIHAEVGLIITAMNEHIDLDGTSVFINLMHCPSCARMIAMLPVGEIVYEYDHSDGYAVGLLQQAGKSIRRVILDKTLSKKEK
jgi:deoxycytidylate deaminase